jgi:hypothetical protein
MLQLLFDYGLEVFVGTVPDNTSSVDEKRRGIVDTEGPSQTNVLIHTATVPSPFQIVLKPDCIEAEFFGIVFQTFRAEEGRILEKNIVHLPVFPLGAGSKEGLRRDVRIISVFIRKVFYDKPDLLRELFQKTLDGRTGRLAMGSLEVKELNDRYRSVGRSPDRSVTDRDIVAFGAGPHQGRKEKQKKEEEDASLH